MTQHGHHHHGPSQAHGFVYAGIYLFKEGGGGEGFREGRWQSRLVSLGEGDADPASTSCWSARGVLNITRPLSGPMCVCVRVSTGLALPLPGVATQPASLLSQPLFKRFTQTRWAAPQQTLEEIISAVAERMPEFSELQDCFREVRGCWAASGGRADRCVCAHTRMRLSVLASSPPWTLAFREVLGSHGPAHSPTQELLEVVHLHLVKEYIARLCKRRLVLKTAEQQQQLAGHVQANAQLIQQFCTQNVSPRVPPQPPTAVGCPPAPSSSWAWTAPLGLSKPDQARPEPLWASGRASGQGQPLSTKPVPAGLPGHLAAPRPPHARRDHSPARPQCHQDRGGHLRHLVPRLQVRTGASKHPGKAVGPCGSPLQSEPWGQGESLQGGQSSDTGHCAQILTAAVHSVLAAAWWG